MFVLHATAVATPLARSVFSALHYATPLTHNAEPVARRSYSKSELARRIFYQTQHFESDSSTRMFPNCAAAAPRMCCSRARARSPSPDADPGQSERGQHARGRCMPC
jgi:hypothetical protein